MLEVNFDNFIESAPDIMALMSRGETVQIKKDGQPFGRFEPEKKLSPQEYVALMNEAREMLRGKNLKWSEAMEWRKEGRP